MNRRNQNKITKKDSSFRTYQVSNSRSREQRLRREVVLLKKKLASQKQLTKKWSKKYYRLMSKTEKPSNSIDENVDNIIKSGKNAIKSRLTFCEALVSQIKERKSSLKTEANHSMLNQVLAGKILKKYRVMRQATQIMSMHAQRKYMCKNDITLKRENRSKAKVHSLMAQSIEDFLTKDEHSYPAPGKKDVIVRNGKVTRKRYLADSLDHLYKKYQLESHLQVSRTTFFRLKPFWVVYRSINSRETCLCKVHENFKILLENLTNLNVIKTKSSREFVASITCDPSQQTCMYRNCQSCIQKCVPVPANDEPAIYEKWVTQDYEKQGARGKKFSGKETIKKKIQCNVSDIVYELNTSTKNYLRHVFDTSHQYRNLTNLRINLGSNEVYIVIDFSENFMAKYAKAIQSAHFGASAKQISLHTGCFFFKDLTSQKIECVSFGTVSDCLRHDASAIWAHMNPVFELMKLYVPEIKKIHFQSDGPSAQYKNKTNFFLSHYYSKKSNWSNMSWNFTTSGHGKSFADGVGGTIKRQCDSAVTHGKDILSASDIVNVFENSSSEIKIHVFEISETEMKNIDALIPNDLRTIPNTRAIHQIIWTDQDVDKLFLGSLTCCECIYLPPCKHFSLNPNFFKYEEKRNDDLSSPVDLTEIIFKKDDWLAVINNNKTWVPGIVEAVFDDHIIFSPMRRTGKKLFWPKKKYSCEIKKEKILCKIVEPPTFNSNSFSFSDQQYKFIAQEFKGKK